MDFVTKRKRKLHDRPDGHLLKKITAMNLIMASIYPNRCDCEVSSTSEIDITNLLAFIKKHNEEKPDHPIKFFHAMITALARLMNERRLLLRFVQHYRFYERDEIKISFTAKRGFYDHAEEAIITYVAKGTDTIEDVAAFILGQVKDQRDPEILEKEKKSNGTIEGLERFPQFIFRTVGKYLRFCDRHCPRLLPKAAFEVDPSFTGAMVANLGSIKAESCYHHLNNYGSCSMMITIGTIKKKKVTNEDGTVSYRDVVDITATFDERIADGFYFIKSVQLFKHYLEDIPECLLKPLQDKVD